MTTPDSAEWVVEMVVRVSVVVGGRLSVCGGIQRLKVGDKGFSG